MKCMICHSQTLPGSRLCKPCRSALRRARDDTISELLPLPRRLDALAWQPWHTVAGPATVVALPSRASSRSLPRWVDRARLRMAESPLRATGVLLIVLAVGMLAFIGTRQMHIERDEPARNSPPASPSPATVSPAALAAAAREDAAKLVEDPVVTAAPVVAAPPMAAPRGRRAPAKAVTRPAPEAAAAAVANPLAAFGPLDESRAAPSAAAPPSPPVPVAPRTDRWQALSSTLARCGSPDLWERGACEQSARVRYCDGYWGQTPMCPAGVFNDHGQ
jgi:hypothetical protein